MEILIYMLVDLVNVLYVHQEVLFVVGQRMLYSHVIDARASVQVEKTMWRPLM